MPGFQDCDLIDDDASLWLLKVGVGGLVRKVKVNVRVDRWDGPERALFSYSLQGDPVTGSGSYRAKATGPDETEIMLKVCSRGQRPYGADVGSHGRPRPNSLARLQSNYAMGSNPWRAICRPGGKRVSGGFAWLREMWRRCCQADTNSSLSTANRSHRKTSMKPIGIVRKLNRGARPQAVCAISLHKVETS